MKLRVYGGLVPLLVIALASLLRPDRSGFSVAYAGSMLGLLPFLALGSLRMSQKWQATDVSRAAPVLGPAQLCHGARRAVLAVLMAPILLVLLGAVLLLHVSTSDLLLMLPGIIALPVFAIVPCVGGRAVPLSLPPDEARGAARGALVISLVLVALALAGLTLLARRMGLFWWLVAGESVIAVGLYVVLRLKVNEARWPALE